MKYAAVKKEMRKAMRGIKVSDTRKGTTLGEKVLAMFGNDTKANDMLGDMIQACHSVKVNIFTEKATAKAIAFIILSGLKKRPELEYCTAPIDEAIDSLKVGDKEWKLLANTIDVINGMDTKDSLIKASAIFYKVAKEG